MTWIIFTAGILTGAALTVCALWVRTVAWIGRHGMYQHGLDETR